MSYVIGAEGPFLQIGEVFLTLEQLEELYLRVQSEDFQEVEDHGEAD